MFRLTREEIMRISQFVISSAHRGVRTLKFSKNVMAFTEHGVAMLSSVLKEIYLDCDGNTLLLKVDQKGGRPVIRVSGVASTSGLKEESGKLKERKSLTRRRYTESEHTEGWDPKRKS